MSPSMMPTRLPSFASAMARLTATVVLPTPPLPAPTAMMLRMPGIRARPQSGREARGGPGAAVRRRGRPRHGGHVDLDGRHPGDAADGRGRLVTELLLDRTR